MTIRIEFVCGHSVIAPDDVSQAPACQICGDRRVRDVIAPAPRFRGAVSGPQATPGDVTGPPPNLAPGGPLPIKEPA